MDAQHRKEIFQAVAVWRGRPRPQAGAPRLGRVAMNALKVVPSSPQQVGRVFAAARRAGNYGVLVWCKSCRRWLPHFPGRCARLAVAPAPRCVCGVHTCYAEERDIAPEGGETYVDFA